MLRLCRRREGETAITMTAPLESLALARLSCDCVRVVPVSNTSGAAPGLIGGLKLAEARLAVSGVLTADTVSALSRRQRGFESRRDANNYSILRAVPI